MRVAVHERWYRVNRKGDGVPCCMENGTTRIMQIMTGLEYYHDILIRTPPQGHPAAFALFQQAELELTDPLIELGAGEGAFTARLRDAGFTNLAAVEIESARFQLDLPCYSVDLNGDFASELPGPYAGIVALEIIEHLENPLHFLRQCLALARPGGYLLLSTPNIAMAEGRLRFLRHGVLTRFADPDIIKMGHIAPLPENLLRHHIARVGWTVVAQGINAPRLFTDPRRDLPWWRGGPLWKLCWPLVFAMMKGQRVGDMLIYLLQKPA
jgi:hypothetical protein